MGAAVMYIGVVLLSSFSKMAIGTALSSLMTERTCCPPPPPPLPLLHCPMYRPHNKAVTPYQKAAYRAQAWTFTSA